MLLSDISLKFTQPLHLQKSSVWPQYPDGEQQCVPLLSGLHIGNKPFSNFKDDNGPHRGSPGFSLESSVCHRTGPEGLIGSSNTRLGFLA